MLNERWVSFFKEDYLTFSEAILTPDRTKLEVEQLVGLLQLPQEASILDLGCGQGRIAVPLSQIGYRVTAMDGSLVMLDAARKYAMESAADVTFVEKDMRNLDDIRKYNAILNLGTAFGYVPDQSDDENIMGRIFSALKPGGQLIMDVENRDGKLRQLGRTWADMMGIKIFSDREYDAISGRWKETLSWFVEGKEVCKVLDVRLYSVTELIRMMSGVGLIVKDIFGGLDLSPFQLNSPRLVLRAIKPGG